MRRRILFSSVTGLGLLASLATPADAQQGGTPQGQTRPAPVILTPVPRTERVPDPVAAQRYSLAGMLNRGDAITASALYSLGQVAADIAVSGLRDIPDITLQQIREYGSAQHAGFNADIGAYAHRIISQGGGPPLSPAQREAEYAAFSANMVPEMAGLELGRPTSAPGSRQTSAYESAQNQAFQTYLNLIEQRLEVVRNLNQIAGQNPSQSDREALDYLRTNLLAEQSFVTQTLQESRLYAGRAFTNDNDARAYLQQREVTASMVADIGSQHPNNYRVLTNESFSQMVDGLNARLNIYTPAAPLSLALSESMRALSVTERRLVGQGRDISIYNRIDRDMESIPQTLADVARRYPSPAASPSGQANTASSGAGGRGGGGGSTASSGPIANNLGRPRLTEADDNRPPRPVPTAPDYPTNVRTPEDRLAYNLRRAAQQAQADAARQAALQREYEAESARQAEIARREAARLENERFRIRQAMHRLAAQNADWNAMVEDRFSQAVWDAFARNGGNLSTLELESIYAGYDVQRSAVIPPARSLSSAPNSLSAAGRSLSAAGTPVRSGTDDYDDPAVQSLYEALYGLTQRRRGPLGPSEDEIQTANFGDYDLYSDPDGRWGRESGGYVGASLFSEELDYLQRSFVNGRNGLQGLLAQPFNVLLTWGAGAFDLDLHMTGPTGLGQTDRFHIYYAATGSLESFPFAALIRDCICRSGSEVILTSNLLGGGVYRVSVFNFGDQAANSTNLANASEARIQIVRGGVAVAQGNGTTIQGGRLILDTRVPIGQFGNTWVAVELDPRTGRITVPRAIRQSEGSANVR